MILNFFDLTMPKEKSHRCVTNSQQQQKNRSHPYKHSGKGSKSDNGEECDARRDWDDAICPICLEFPHNAVLLLCSSHDKGCRPYMCNTSYRHSNCLDQYRRAQVAMKKSQGPIQVILEAETHPELVLEARSNGDSRDMTIVDSNNSATFSRRLTRRLASVTNHHNDLQNVSEDNLRIANMDTISTRRLRRSVSIPSNGITDVVVNSMDLETASMSEMEGMEESDQTNHSTASSSGEKCDIKDLMCPLCRGKVDGWRVMDVARKHMNEKSRSCSHESCSFVGTYEELRGHARCQHPFSRPSEIDPNRQRDWRRLERQRDIGDVLSSIRSAMPNSSVFGDYVIENEGEGGNEHENDVDFTGDDGHWWTVFLLFQFFSLPVGLLHLD